MGQRKSATSNALPHSPPTESCLKSYILCQKTREYEHTGGQEILPVLAFIVYRPRKALEILAYQRINEKERRIVPAEHSAAR